MYIRPGTGDERIGVRALTVHRFSIFFQTNGDFGLCVRAAGYGMNLIQL